MADGALQAPEPGQYAAAAEHTIRAASALDPWAQAILAAGFCASVLAWIVTRRPPAAVAPGAETLTIVVKAMEEQARATADLAGQVERLVEQNAVIVSELRGGAVLR
ncbi:MAG TPA: hypothetical protein VD860_16885 [Azospirillum sp.]|nr:hypothetical protein [Azospirillum sp.]